ncbi:MAG: hypothetical protein LBQ31_02530 [Bacteroidales bacterium]|jgi:hypothetical protein|nr:hypothetical protein [Bacteroidales bacterium]
MKIICIILLSVTFFGQILWGQSKQNKQDKQEVQDKPLWLDNDIRSIKYSKNSFFTGYAEGSVNAGETIETAIERIKTTAQSMLIESIRVNIKSQTKSETISLSRNKGYDESEEFRNSTEKYAAAEIVGMKIESYFDKKSNYIYAFAYTGKYEVTEYYKSNLSMLLQQAEGVLLTAKQLEQSGEKTKARKECQDVIPLLVKVRYAQDLLTTLGTKESLQQDKSEQLRGEATQMLARLEQAIFLYVESNETLLGTKSDIMANRLKAALANSGCSFTDDLTAADFILTLSGSTRILENTDATFKFCYVDVVLSLHDTHKKKDVYTDEISKKGGANDYNRAARQAYQDVVTDIAAKIKPWIE